MPAKLPEEERRARRLASYKKSSSGWYQRNKERHKAWQKAWREANPEKAKELGTRWRKNNPEKAREISRAFEARHKEKRAEKNRKWAAANRERKNASRRKCVYGVTAEEYARMNAEQGGLCAICGGTNGEKQLAVDHCHKTGIVRQLLCGCCNTSLGGFRDSIELLLKAIEYLKRHQRTPGNEGC